MITLDPIEEIIADVRAGKLVVLIDDKNRENEGDLFVAAERVTPEIISFMMEEGKGLICLSLTEERRLQLGLPFQVQDNSSPFGTNFAVSFDLAAVAKQGVTAVARACSILAAVDPQTRANDLSLPGFVFPVVADSGGVLRRRGQTEGSVDLARLAGLQPAGVICEIMGEHGQMLRGGELNEFCRRHSLRIGSVEALVQYRLQHEISLRRIGSFSYGAERNLLRTERISHLLKESGEQFRVIVYIDDVDEKEHLALVCGEPKENSLVRIHSECLTGDVFSSRRCDCGSQFDRALELILAEKNGVLVYLQQEGRGIGLGNKLRAYELQDKGLDTVDANIHLGFAADERNYRAGAQILSDLELTQVRLITNNPEKVRALESFGIKVAERIPLVAIDEHNRAYMLTKQRRLGHIFEQ